MRIEPARARMDPLDASFLTPVGVLVFIVLAALYIRRWNRPLPEKADAEEGTRLVNLPDLDPSKR